MQPKVVIAKSMLNKIVRLAIATNARRCQHAKLGHVDVAFAGDGVNAAEICA
jgi:hypothetical protein